MPDNKDIILGDDGRIHLGEYEPKPTGAILTVNCETTPGLRPMNSWEARIFKAWRRCPHCFPSLDAWLAHVGP